LKNETFVFLFLGGKDVEPRTIHKFQDD